MTDVDALRAAARATRFERGADRAAPFVAFAVALASGLVVGASSGRIAGALVALLAAPLLLVALVFAVSARRLRAHNALAIPLGAGPVEAYVDEARGLLRGDADLVVLLSAHGLPHGPRVLVRARLQTPASLHVQVVAGGELEDAAALARTLPLADAEARALRAGVAQLADEPARGMDGTRCAIVAVTRSRAARGTCTLIAGASGPTSALAQRLLALAGPVVDDATRGDADGSARAR